jgi:hypothetical protein
VGDPARGLADRDVDAERVGIRECTIDNGRLWPNTLERARDDREDHVPKSRRDDLRRQRWIPVAGAEANRT